MDAHHDLLERLQRSIAELPPAAVPTQKQSGARRPEPEPATLEAAREQISQLETALEHRTITSEAVGMLMERFGINGEQAFLALAQVSMDTNRKVYDLARELISTGHTETL